MEFSVKVNLYTTLLGRSAGFNTGKASFEHDISELAKYAISRLGGHKLSGTDRMLIEAA